MCKICKNDDGLKDHFRIKDELETTGLIYWFCPDCGRIDRPYHDEFNKLGFGVWIWGSPDWMIHDE